MTATLWFVITGALLILMGLAGSVLRRLPFSTGIVYLLVGYALGPSGAALLVLDPVRQSAWLGLVSEIALLISLFAVGLKLRVPFSWRVWQMPLRLGVIAMLVTIALIAIVGISLLGLSPGAALLLGAVLAPTDPVLASDVQLRGAEDEDRLRFSLTAEGGLNDGVAFPFVLLGLGLLALHDIGSNGMRWIARDLMWAVAAGLGSGWLLGRTVSSVVVHLRGRFREALGLEEFFTLGLIALSYGVALALHCNGFLAVFAAGLALRRMEHAASGARAPKHVIGEVRAGGEDEVATNPEKAPAYMVETVVDFNEQLERIAEVVVVVMLGSLLSADCFSTHALMLAALLFLVIRPLSAVIALAGSGAPRTERRLIAWFGIRGIGSIYYLLFALQQGLHGDLAHQFTVWTLGVVAISIVIHGVSATPLMQRYHRRRRICVKRFPKHKSCFASQTRRNHGNHHCGNVRQHHSGRARPERTVAAGLSSP